ncbi:MAG: hypothetical protein ACRD2T_14750, partial [Thermoanaerobaculia bacterium]
AEVIARSVEETREGAWVVYRCLRDGAPGELRAAPRGPRHRVSAWWRGAEGEREAAEVEVVGSSCLKRPPP